MAAMYPRLLPPPVKGKSDWREFRCLELENGLTLILVHDNTSPTLAAAATVPIGAAADPIPGLAHFCEHMCFLGSRKYPGENEYKKYLSQHGGRSNASTSLQFTTYKMELLAEHAQPALDMFGQFFVDPLFTASGTAREVQAVDAENSKNLTADARRRLQILKALGRDDHPFTNFTTGHEGTLGRECRDLLLAFHRKHYRPDGMVVVVAGPQSLDELQEWTAPIFGAMEPKEPLDSEEDRLVERAVQGVAMYDRTKEPTFDNPWSNQEQNLPLVCLSEPLRPLRKLVLLFPIPPVWNIETSPTSLLSHVLGHEGKHSAFAALQDAGWITSLVAGHRTIGPDFGLFQVDISLTEEGETKWQDVVKAVWTHCRLVADSSDEDLICIWEEYAQSSELQFDYSSPSGVYDLAPRLSQSVVTRGTVLSMGSVPRAPWPMDKLREVASSLVPENCMIERCSKFAWEEVRCLSLPKQTEKWYGLEYCVLPARDQWKSLLDPDTTFKTSLPAPNLFLPRSLELCSDLPPEATVGPRIDHSVSPPVLLVNENNRRLWHRLDDRYALPKASIQVLIRNAAVENRKSGDHWEPSAVASIQSSLLATVFSDAMAQETYDSGLAGLDWHLSLSSSGISMTFSGFSDRLPDLAMQIAEAWCSAEFLQNESIFRAAQDRLKRQLESFFESRRADALATYYRDLLLCSHRSGIAESLDAVNRTTLNDLRLHHSTLMSNRETSLECLYSGNVSEGEARSTFASFVALVTKRSEALLADGPCWIPGTMERQIPSGQDIEMHFSSQNKKEENGVVVMSFQSDVPGYRGSSLSTQASLTSTASIRLLCSMLREPFFNELRTVQSLGYIVSSYYDMGLSIRSQAELVPKCLPIDYIELCVLGSKAQPTEVAQLIDAFMKDFRQKLIEMPTSEIESQATALTTKLLKPPQKLSTESSTQFSKISRYAPEVLSDSSTHEDLPWDSVEHLAARIRTLNHRDLLSTFDRVVASRTRIVSCVYGSKWPLQPHSIQKEGAIVQSLPGILKVREGLPVFGSQPSRSTWWKSTWNPQTRLVIGATAVSAAGAFVILRNYRKR